MRQRLCHRTEIEHQFPVTLYQTGIDRFTVQYGQQVKSELTYNEAAREYGSSIMHALACADLLDNRERTRA